MDSNSSCFPWEDYVELHESNLSAGLLVFCLTILAVDILLMVLILSTEELRKQVVNKIPPVLAQLFRE